MLLTAIQKEELYKIYIEYLSNHIIESDQSVAFVAKNCLMELENKEKFMSLIDKIEITLDFDTIMDIYKKTGLIMLRKPENEESILLGCGRNPPNLTDEYKNKNPDKHYHRDYYTIDPDISMAPSIIAFFGTDNEKLSKVFKIYGKTFSSITTETVNSIVEKKETAHKWNYDFLPNNFVVQELQSCSNIPEIKEAKGPTGLENITKEEEDSILSEDNSKEQLAPDLMFSCIEKMREKYQKPQANLELRASELSLFFNHSQPVNQKQTSSQLRENRCHCTII